LGGRYRITRELGRGGMSIVFEATSLKLGRRFAIKVPRAERPLTGEARRRLEREISLGATLESSHIARVFDWDTDGNGTPFVVMEYVPGEDLRRVLARSGPMPLRRAVNLMLQVCRGLAVAHRQGVIHRDLKPSNLAVTPELSGYEHCTLLDFGVAKMPAAVDGDSTRTGAMVGTLAYMPPEQIRGEKDLDARADLYALGTILFECLSGQRAFDADSQHALMYRILHGPPPSLTRLLPDLPPAVESFLIRALAADRAARFQSVDEFALALEKLLPAGAERVSVDAETMASELRTQPAILPSRARKPRRTALVIAIGLVALSVAVLLISSRGQPVFESRSPATSEPPPVATVAVATSGAPAPPVSGAIPAARPEASVHLVPIASPPAPAPAKPSLHAKPRARQPPPAAAPSAAPADAGPAAPSDPLKERGYVLVSPYDRTPPAAFE
jgi:serine/threonine-protein kinase